MKRKRSSSDLSGQSCEKDPLVITTTSTTVGHDAHAASKRYNSAFYNYIPRDIWTHHILARLDAVSLYRFAMASTYFLVFDRLPKFDQSILDAVRSLHSLIRMFMGRQDLVQRLLIVDDALLGKFRFLAVLDIDNRYGCRVSDKALARMCNLRSLNLKGDAYVSDQGITSLTNLLALVLCSHPGITDCGISGLTGLYKLVLSHNTHITDTGLAPLAQRLHYLEISGLCPGITDRGVAQLTRLTWLDLSGNPYISDEALTSMTTLKQLVLFGNERITDNAISRLTSLHALHLSESPVTDRGLVALTNLTTLDLFSTMPEITAESLTRLTQLRQLGIPDVDHLGDETISCMTGLHSLSLSRNPCVTNKGLKCLTGLTQLSLRGNQRITNEALFHLTGLVRLNLAQNRMITLNGIKHLTLLKQLNTYESPHLGGVRMEEMQRMFPSLKNYAPYQSDKHGMIKDT